MAISCYAALGDGVGLGPWGAVQYSTASCLRWVAWHDCFFSGDRRGWEKRWSELIGIWEVQQDITVQHRIHVKALLYGAPWAQPTTNVSGLFWLGRKPSPRVANKSFVRSCVQHRMRYNTYRSVLDSTPLSLLSTRASTAQNTTIQYSTLQYMTAHRCQFYMTTPALHSTS